MSNETLDSFPIAENESALANDLYTFPVKAMVKICHLNKSLEWFCMQASDRKVKRAKWKESKFCMEIDRLSSKITSHGTSTAYQFIPGEKQ